MHTFQIYTGCYNKIRCKEWLQIQFVHWEIIFKSKLYSFLSDMWYVKEWNNNKIICTYAGILLSCFTFMSTAKVCLSIKLQHNSTILTQKNKRDSENCFSVYQFVPIYLSLFRTWKFSVLNSTHKENEPTSDLAARESWLNTCYVYNGKEKC